MKHLLVALLAALMLAAPASLAASVRTESTAQDSKKEAKTVTVSYKVNMHCENCVKKLTNNLSLMRGVTDFKISLEDQSVIITYDPAKVKEDRFVQVIKKLGYTAEKV